MNTRTGKSSVILSHSTTANGARRPLRAAVTAEMPFEAIVRLIARQTAAGKTLAPLLLNVRSFEFLAQEWDLLPLVRRPAHLPWAIPVLAGVSNVNLRGVVGREGESLPVRNYFRGTCTTNLVPMMLGITTMRDTCSLTTTHRPSIFTAAQMDELAAHVGRRLFGEELGHRPRTILNSAPAGRSAESQSTVACHSL